MVKVLVYFVNVAVNHIGTNSDVTFAGNCSDSAE